MNALLCLALGLLQTAALCHGQCMITQLMLQIDPATGEVVQDCRDDEGVLHSIGDTWNNKDCYKCRCNRFTLDCCKEVPTYSGLPESCKVVVNNNCTHQLVNSQGPDSDCDPKSDVLDDDDLF